MKVRKNLFLSSAASLCAAGAAQGADLPIRAQPVEYVKICSLYGDGFYYIPGTSTCIQFSGVAQWEVGYNVGSGQGDLAIGSLTSFAPAATTNAGDNSRMTGRYQQRARMGLATDVRWQTDYGTLRAFGSFRADYVDQQNLNGGTSIAADRAFVQWAGWTVGRVQSLSDVPNLGPLGPQVLHRAGWFQKDTGASGNNEISYTWELGNGMSLSTGAGERQVKPISNLSLNSGFALGSSSNATRGLFSPEDQLFDQHAGQTLPNPFVAFKINQAWGAFGVSVNGNYNRALNYGSQATGGGGFFQSELSTATAGLPPFAGLANEGFAIPGVSPSHGDPLGTNNQGVIGIPGYAPSLACIQSPQSSFCGYPKDKWGGAVNVGASINAPWIAAGDKFGGMFAYGVGATSYVAGVMASPWLYDPKKNSFAHFPVSDAIYVNGSNLELTTAWTAGAYYLHNWTPGFLSYLYGFHTAIEYNKNVTGNPGSDGKFLNGVGGWFCGFNGGYNTVLQTSAPGAAPTFLQNAGQGGANPFNAQGVMRIRTGTNPCDPSGSIAGIGFGTKWFPRPNFLIGIEVLYTHVNSGFDGGTVTFARNTANPNAGGQQPGTNVFPIQYNFGDANILSVQARVQVQWPGRGG